MNTNTIIIAILALAFLSACNEKEPTVIEMSLKSTELVEATNTFGFEFFQTIIENEDADKNIMVSPLSVNQALCMALNGAQNNTLMEMQSTLDFESLTLEDINKENQTLYNALVDHDPKVELSIANSVWYRNDFSPKDQFVKDNEQYYFAEVDEYDPAETSEALKDINKWVDKNTNGKIEKIIDQISDEDVMFLINAIYFNAEWETKFKKSDTRDEEFTCDDGTTKNVATMIGEAHVTYKNEDKYSAIKLPYGSGKFNMVVYLPEEGYTTEDVLPELPETDFEHLNTSSTSKMDIWFPKFEFEYENELNDELTTMGINDAFSSTDADFGKISDIDLYISRVKHKTYIKTNEEGTEAAATTGITIGCTSVGPGEIIKINKSFLFAIVEEDTNAILFIGRVFDPSI